MGSGGRLENGTSLIGEPELKSIIATVAKVDFVDWLRERKNRRRNFGKALRAPNRTVAFDKILARKWQNLIKTT